MKKPRQSPLGAKQLAFLIFSYGEQAGCLDAQNYKDGPQDTGLQRPVMIQGEIPAEVIHQVIVDPRKVISHGAGGECSA